MGWIDEACHVHLYTMKPASLLGRRRRQPQTCTQSQLERVAYSLPAVFDPQEEGQCAQGCSQEFCPLGSNSRIWGWKSVGPIEQSYGRCSVWGIFFSFLGGGYPAEARTFYRSTLYTSAVFAVIVCLSVRPSVSPSQAGIVSKRLDESNWVLARRLPSTYPTLCDKEIWVSSKIISLPSETLSQTPNSWLFCLPTACTSTPHYDNLYFSPRIVA